jgi:hypothetical protein
LPEEVKALQAVEDPPGGSRVMQALLEALTPVPHAEDVDDILPTLAFDLPPPLVLR